MTYRIVKDPDGVLCITMSGGDVIARGSAEMADLVDILMLALKSAAMRSTANCVTPTEAENV